MANAILFTRNTNIGAADAESDDAYLANCFVDTGDVETLSDCSNPKALVLGRTGAGKTALLKQILRKHKEHSVELSPEALSLNFVTNSSVLQFFEESGVQLDIFYTLLWRHIITVELLKLRYGIENEVKQKNFIRSMISKFTADAGKAKAINYLQEWGGKFWEETEYRTKEFTRKLETDLTASAKLDTKYISLGAEGARKLTEEQVIEVREVGTRIVNGVQVRDLHNVIKFLSEDVFIDRRTQYFIVIDRLDEDWVDDRIKFKLIKALIEMVRTFHKIHCVKIIVALRSDLHQRVLRETPSAGFQEEKYKSLYLHLRWTRSQLERVLADRVAYLFRWKYTKSNVRLSDIIASSQIDRRTIIEYMLDRTFFRPREAILYLNECLALSEGRSMVSPQIVRKAEGTYSQQRLASLYDEWRREYPNLELAVSIVRGRESRFEMKNVDKASCEEMAAYVIENARGSGDNISNLCEKFYIDNKLTEFDFFREIVVILYQVGLLGITIVARAERLWSFEGLATLVVSQIRPESALHVHKTFWSSLGILRREIQ